MPEISSPRSALGAPMGCRARDEGGRSLPIVGATRSPSRPVVGSTPASGAGIRSEFGPVAQALWVNPAELVRRLERLGVDACDGCYKRLSECSIDATRFLT